MTEIYKENLGFYVSYFIIPLLVTVLYWLYKPQRIMQSKDGLLPLPPCLPSLPIVGSLPFIPNFEKIFLAFMDFRSKYGDVFAFYAGPRYTVVLNGLEVIQDLLIKKGQFTSNRESPVFDKHINPEARGMAFSRYSEQYKSDRMTSMSILKDFGLGKNATMEQRIQAELTELINSINKLNGQTFNPEELMRLTTQNVICRLMLDERFEENDEEGKLISNFVQSFEEAVIPAMLIFPILRYLPRFSKRLSHVKLMWQQFRSLMNNKIQLLRDSETNNFCKEYIYRTGDKYNKENLVYLLRDLLTTGSGATGVQICWALILIANHPEVKEKLQKEFDSVVARKRLPSFEDKTRLPYLEAVLLETLRLKMLVPVTPPRITEQDLELAGFRIPGNSMLAINLWSLHMNPAIWTDPEEFKPERFLSKDNEIINKDMIYPFSLGRRSCVGEPLARQELFHITAALIQMFDILPPEGQDKVVYKENNAIVRKPEFYKLRFVPRLM